MRILVVGGGGREHALLWKLAQSPRVTALFCAPGNAGTPALAETVAIPIDRIEDLREFARAHAIDCTIVGPELPLVRGLADVFAAAGLRVFGPGRRAAELEGSKAFAKRVMERAGVPTAAHRTFDDAEAASAHARALGAPLVVKADGLAAGKGVIVCASVDEALGAIDAVMVRRSFGEAGRRIVIEEFLAGEEVSFMALSDGRTVVPLASSQDHKRLADGDRGPNTGGMGAYSPSPLVTPALERAIMDDIIRPTLATLAAEGIPYRGVLYAGLMVEHGHARVLEFNVRFGDPECQVLMLRLRSDLVDLIAAVLDERLAACTPEWDPRPSVGIVLAAEGYPGEPVHGAPISGLDAAPADGTVVFHSGTTRHRDEVVASGGRVLTVAALGDDLAAAVERAYAGVARVGFRGMQYRRDIAHRAFAPPPGAARPSPA
jgi:phosphoribosylamine--glycine ligase